jgi:hypothetical protein
VPAHHDGTSYYYGTTHDDGATSAAHYGTAATSM